jgi:hypothetical protein
MERGMVNYNIKNMLLTLLLNLGMAAGTVATPPTPPSGGGGGNEHSYSKNTSKKSEKEKNDKFLERVLIDDSEIVAIVQICLKLTVI